jgi:uncharacterized protein (TIGR00106 family)
MKRVFRQCLRTSISHQVDAIIPQATCNCYPSRRVSYSTTTTSSGVIPKDVVVELSIFPLDKGSSVSTYVAKSVKVIKNSEIPFVVNPMGTCIEGEYHEVMTIVGKCFDAMKEDCDRIYMTMKVDYRKGASGRLVSKPKSIASKI